PGPRCSSLRGRCWRKASARRAGRMQAAGRMQFAPTKTQQLVHWEARMTTGDEVKSADQVSAILEQAYYELATEARLARVGLKERQETAPIVERYRDLYTRPQIAAL